MTSDKFDKPISLNQRNDAGETDSAYLALLCYLELGRGRSFAKAFHNYRIKKGTIPEGTPFDAANRPSPYFTEWAKEFEWKKRKDDYDNWQDLLKTHSDTERRNVVVDNAWEDYNYIRMRIKKMADEMDSRETDNVTARELLELTRAMTEADSLGRRLVGLPDRYNQSKVDKTVQGNITTTNLSAEELSKLNQDAVDELEDWNEQSDQTIEAVQRLMAGPADDLESSSRHVDSGANTEGMDEVW